jgi:hypothetical protein
MTTTTTTTTMRATMMTMTKTTTTAMDNNAKICLKYYYDHMRCTRRKLMEIPLCEPITPLG